MAAGQAAMDATRSETVSRLLDGKLRNAAASDFSPFELLPDLGSLSESRKVRLGSAQPPTYPPGPANVTATRKWVPDFWRVLRHRRRVLRHRRRA